MSEFRKDPIIDRWIIVTQNRLPINIKKTTKKNENSNYDKNCPFCEGNEINTPTEITAYTLDKNFYRKQNEKGWDLRIVPDKNVFLRIEEKLNKKGEGIYDKISGLGAHEIIIETPHHLNNLLDLEERQIELIFTAYKDRITDLKKDTRFEYILIYKNQGESAGGKINHAHSHLIAMPIIPKRIIEELIGAKRHFNYKGRCVFCDIIDEEIRDKERIIYETSDFIAFCPFASRTPFEICIMPKEHLSNFEFENNFKMNLLAKFLKIVLKKFNLSTGNNNFNLILHNAPINLSNEKKEHYFVSQNTFYHWHIEIVPNFQNIEGFEKGSGFYINSIAPEICAEYMRNC